MLLAWRWRRQVPLTLILPAKAWAVIAVAGTLASWSPQPVDVAASVGQWGLALGAFVAAAVVSARAPRADGLVGLGASIGIAVMVLATLAGAAGAWPAGALPGRLQGWADHPNVWAAMIVTPAVLAAATRSWLRWPAVAAAIVIVLATGSRTAALALALALGMLALWPPRPQRWSRARVAVLSATLLAVGAAAMLLPLDVRARYFGAFGAVPDQVNLLQASEHLDFGSWSTPGTTVARSWSLDPANTWLVTKVDGAWWARVQQVVRMEPGETLRVRFEYRPDDAAQRVGVHGTVIGGGGSFRAYVEPNGPGSTDHGFVEVGPVTRTHLGGHWYAFDATFASTAETPIALNFGPTPDARDGTAGARLAIRRPHVSRGDQAVGYAPTFAPSFDTRAARTSAADRRAYFAVAWEGFLQAPLTGNGVGAYPAAYAASPHASASNRVGHAHNLLLQALFERGWLGALGVLTLLLVPIVRTWPLGTSATAIVVAVIVANTFDLTFWSAGTAYQAFAVLGHVVGLRNATATSDVTRRPLQEVGGRP